MCACGGHGASCEGSAKNRIAPIGAYVYDWVIRDTLVARGEEPAPGVEERGRTVQDEA
ncbi:MAG TPA: hypothetical protein VLA98_08880 [Solirubrobacteraceae bacterium]|nr:hypothetical protein [Solirubrobacteraceae bacterium]